MSRKHIVDKLISSGAIAVIRMRESQKVMNVIEAIGKGGIRAVEITVTTPNAMEMIEATAKTMGDDVQLGVGSVLDSETAQRAVNAGATFVVSPVFRSEIIDVAHQGDLPAIPGAFSPTEIESAYEYGADIVKVFPADVLGMKFFKGILAPMPHLKIMPTGGVSLTNAGDWLKAGACAVAVGSALLDKKAIADENYSVLTDNARTLCESIVQARKGE